MKLNSITPSRFAELLTSALREGIASERTAGYKTDDGYTLFIEPHYHRVSAYYKHILIIQIEFYPDNVTWDTEQYGEATGAQDQIKLYAVRKLYNQVKEEKKERTIRHGMSDEQKEMRKRLGLDVDF